MPDATVEFASVTYTLEAGGRTLLHNISFCLEPNTTTALLGRSGSGKTTLLRTVNALVRPTAGTVRVSGRDTATLDPIVLRRGIGYVIQETGLFPHMPVARNAGIALELARRPRSEVEARVRQVLALTGLDFDSLCKRLPWQLSGGQRQRVGLARALALDPPILLMDEPFGALDPITRAEMQTMLRGLLEAVQKTVLLVTHDLDEALFLAQRIIFLEAGSVVADLPADQVLTSGQPQVRNYVSAVHRTVPT